jgi:hypothetical protein
MQQTEAQALAGVRSRLAERFPDVDGEAVATAVDAAHAEMTGPIRDYVPVLVERIVRDRLARGGWATPPSRPHDRPSRAGERLTGTRMLRRARPGRQPGRRRRLDLDSAGAGRCAADPHARGVHEPDSVEG